MDSETFLSTLQTAPVVAILRRPKIDLNYCVKLLIENGIRLLEITIDSDQADQFIRSSRNLGTKGVYVGAGTVTTVELAKKALLSGASFFVTPNYNPQVIDFALKHEVPICSGAMTPTEIFSATGAGANVIKVFPAATLGPNYFRELRGPFPTFPLMATGGISVENASSFLEAGANFLGVGAALIPKTNAPSALEECAKAARRLLSFAEKRLKAD